LYSGISLLHTSGVLGFSFLIQKLLYAEIGIKNKLSENKFYLDEDDAVSLPHKENEKGKSSVVWLLIIQHELCPLLFI
jgi:hypothetical protein